VVVNSELKVVNSELKNLLHEKVQVKLLLAFLGLQKLSHVQVPVALVSCPQNPFPVPGGQPRGFLTGGFKQMVSFTRSADPPP
jgi:hypothetical protein